MRLVAARVAALCAEAGERFAKTAPPLIGLPAPSPRIVTGEGENFGAGAIASTLAIGETGDDSVLLPVMRGSAKANER